MIGFFKLHKMDTKNHLVNMHRQLEAKAHIMNTSFISKHITHTSCTIHLHFAHYLLSHLKFSIDCSEAFQY